MLDSDPLGRNDVAPSIWPLPDWLNEPSPPSALELMMNCRSDPWHGIAGIGGAAGSDVARVHHSVEVESEIDAADRRSRGRRSRGGNGLRHAATRRDRPQGDRTGIHDRVARARRLATHAIGDAQRRAAAGVGAKCLHGHARGTRGTAGARRTHGAVHHAHDHRHGEGTSIKGVDTTGVGGGGCEEDAAGHGVELNRNARKSRAPGRHARAAGAAAVVGIFEYGAGERGGVRASASEQYPSEQDNSQAGSRAAQGHSSPYIRPLIHAGQSNCRRLGLSLNGSQFGGQKRASARGFSIATTKQKGAGAFTPAPLDSRNNDGRTTSRFPAVPHRTPEWTPAGSWAANRWRRRRDSPGR